MAEGVTRNFLTILEAEAQRTARSLGRLGVLALLVLLLAFLFLHDFPPYGFATVPAILALSFLLGLAYTRYFVLESYEVSLRDHWNRWMRWSPSCRTVRECYRKVHDAAPGPSAWIASTLLATLIVAHLFLAFLTINVEATLAETIPLFALDALLLGFFAGRRLLERLWYRRFLHSCNQLLREGKLNLWGVY